MNSNRIKQLKGLGRGRPAASRGKPHRAKQQTREKQNAKRQNDSGACYSMDAELQELIYQVGLYHSTDVEWLVDRDYDDDDLDDFYGDNYSDDDDDEMLYGRGSMSSSSSSEGNDNDLVMGNLRAVFNVRTLKKMLKDMGMNKRHRELFRAVLTEAPLSNCEQRQMEEMVKSRDSTILKMTDSHGALPLNLYSNWTQFSKEVVAFLEGQRALLNLCCCSFDLLPNETVGLLEWDSLSRAMTDNLLRDVKENAARLEVLHSKMLSEKLSSQTAEVQQLRSHIEKLQRESAERPSNGSGLDQSELMERLEAQTACIKEKNRQIASLLDRLNSKRSLVSPSRDEDGEVACCEKDVTCLEPRALIGHIRRALGIGAEFPNVTESRIFRAMRAKLGAALEKLAHDIHSDDAQVVLEVIQNADDNFYEGVEPLLSIKISAERYMWVTNNEVGFTNADVLAISDICSSTKKDASRFIGHKGIGFKSVFKVTHTPYIVSKGFCFRFDGRSEHAERNLGYISPEWVEMDDLEALVRPEVVDPGMTHFFFPFAQPSCFPAEDIYRGVDFLPLFLRKLRTLELALDNRRKVVRVSRVPSASPAEGMEILQLTVDEHTASEDGSFSTVQLRQVTYRLHRKVVLVPSDLQVSQVGRVPPTKTEVILAFPVLDGQQSAEIQNVYSFLPVETAGFRFIVQADFSLVSSRDRVHARDPYNVWLSTMIPVVFLEAFGLTGSNDLREDCAIFLPTKEEVSGTGSSAAHASINVFWRKVMEGIRSRVLDTDCVLTETSRWAKPAAVVVRPYGHEDLFTNDELQAALKKEFVCPKMAAGAVDRLGCQFLTAREALHILAHPCFCVKKKDPGWFGQFYRFLGSKPQSVQELLGVIFVTKMFPLDSGAVTSLEEGPIYSLESGPTYRIGPQVLRLLALDLAVLARDDPARQFLRSVGVTGATTMDIARSIVLYHYGLPKPFYGLPVETTKVTSEQLWEQLRFLKHHWLDIGPLYPYVENGLLAPVQRQNRRSTSSDSDQSCWYCFATFLYMPHSRTAFDDIHSSLSGEAFFLDGEFLQALETGQDTEEWERFLSVHLGVNKSLRVCRTLEKAYEPSVELVFAVNVARADAILGSSAKWAKLLLHLQSNWQNLRSSKTLIHLIASSKSGYSPYLISHLWPDLKEYQNLLLDKDGQPSFALPTIPGVTDKAMLADLGIESGVTSAGLQRLARLLQEPGTLAKKPVRDVAVWSKVYTAMRLLDTQPNFVFVPGPEVDSGTFVLRCRICLEVAPIFGGWTDKVQFRAEDYPLVPGMQEWFKPGLDMEDLTDVLRAVLQTVTPSKVRQKEVIFECFWRMDALLATQQLPCQQDILWILDRAYLLRGRRSAHLLLMPDLLDFYEKFVPEPDCRCPVRFVHPVVARLQHVAAAAVKSLSIPLLSRHVQVCPVMEAWQGYCLFPLGTTQVEVSAFRSASLTNLYRAAMAQLLSSVQALSPADKKDVGNAMRSTTVFVLATKGPKLPVAYAVYGISRAVLEDHFIHVTTDGQNQIIVAPATLALPLEQQVSVVAVRRLCPSLTDDDPVKTAIRQVLDESVARRLDQQCILDAPDELRTFAFEVVVEDSKAIREARECIKLLKGQAIQPFKKFTVTALTATPLLPERDCLGGVQRLDPLPSLPAVVISTAKGRKNTFPSTETLLQEPRWRTSPSLVAPSATVPTKRSESVDSDLNHLPSKSCGHAPVISRSQTQSSSHLRRSADLPEVSTAIERQSGATFADQLLLSRNSPSCLAFTEFPSLRTAAEMDVAGRCGLSENDQSQRAYRDSTLQKIREEIGSWTSDWAVKIERRILASHELQYNLNASENHSQDLNLADEIRQLENEAEMAELLGRWAERAVFRHLSHLCQTRQPLLFSGRYLRHPPLHFGFENWVSPARCHFQNGSDDCEAKGYDFHYRQEDGYEVFIKVKGHAHFSDTFLMSNDEWEVAKKMSDHLPQIFVVLGVNLNVLSSAGLQIIYLLEDPVSLKKQGKIVLEPLQFVVRTAAPPHHPGKPYRSKDAPASSGSTGQRQWKSLGKY